MTGSAPGSGASLGETDAIPSAPARAAQSYDNCTGTIETLPTVISTQGTWCLTKNLTTSMTSGAAITLDGNNITLDCNDFKIGGLQGGLATNATGVFAVGRLNTTIRGCGIRGFRDAVWLNGSASFGGLIEDNRFDNNTNSAVYVLGGGHVIRRNRVVDTGGRPGGTQTNALLVSADQSSVTGNFIVGVTADAAGGDVIGIGAFGVANEIAGNYVSGLVVDDVGSAIGIFTGGGSRSSITDNRLLSTLDLGSSGVSASAGNLCGGNLTSGFAAAVGGGCIDAGGNVSD